MTVNSFDELLEIASSKETDIEKLRVLQQYFLENVVYNYFLDIASEITRSGEGLGNSELKKVFSTEEEKIEEIERFERKYGENFHFSEYDRNRLLSVLGITTEEKKEETNSKKKVYIKIKKLNTPSYDGSIKDSIVRIVQNSTVEENGLIKRGACENFSKFAKKFCDYFSIESKVIRCDQDNHFSLIVTIDGEDRVFDFTRMIGIRDGYLNPNNEQQIDDWFNMSFEKWFELKPKMDISMVDGVSVDPRITKDNYKEYFKTEHQSKKTL